MQLALLILLAFVAFSPAKTNNVSPDAAGTQYWSSINVITPENYTIPDDIVLPTRLPIVMAPEGKIINGLEAEKNQFPYQVLLKITSSLFSGYGLCGGVIITEKCVLTAAHCVDSKEYRWYGKSVSTQCLKDKKKL